MQCSGGPGKRSERRWATPESPTRPRVASNFERYGPDRRFDRIELGDWMETFTEGVRSDLVLERLRSGPDDSRDLESRAVGGLTFRSRSASRRSTSSSIVRPGTSSPRPPRR